MNPQTIMVPGLVPKARMEVWMAVATFTLFFDIAQGLGALILGALVTIGGDERWAFAGASILVAAGFVILRSDANAGRS